MQNITLDAARGSEYIRVFHINVLIALYNKHEFRLRCLTILTPF